MMNEISLFYEICKRDVLLYTRTKSEALLPVIFFILITIVFATTITPIYREVLWIAGPILWIGILLALLLSAESLYRKDYESGYLEQLVLNPHSLSWILLAKIIAHIICIGLPLLCVIPILGISLRVPIQLLPAWLLNFAIGIPALCFIISIGSSLTISLRRGGILLSVLLIPLMMPIVIFGCSALTAINNHLPWWGESYLLCAFLLIVAVSAPWVSAFAIKFGLE